MRAALCAAWVLAVLPRVGDGETVPRALFEETPAGARPIAGDDQRSRTPPSYAGLTPDAVFQVIGPDAEPLWPGSPNCELARHGVSYLDCGTALRAVLSRHGVSCHSGEARPVHRESTTGHESGVVILAAAAAGGTEVASSRGQETTTQQDVEVAVASGDAAAESEIPPAPPWPSPPAADDIDFGALLSNMVRGTLLVLGLMGASLWGLRRWMQNQTRSDSSEHGLRVIGSVMLAPRCQLKLVETDGRQAFVGIDSGGVKCITVLPQQFAESLALAEDGRRDAREEMQSLPVPLRSHDGPRQHAA